MLVGELLDMNVRRNPDSEAIVFHSTRLTYRQFRKRCNRLANALLDLNEKKARIAVLQENCHQYFELIFGAPKAGMTTVPLNYRLGIKELAYIINDSAASTLFVSEEYLEQIESIRNSLSTVKNFVLVDGRRPGYLNYEDLLNKYPESNPQVDIDEDDVAWFIYTSGTTGLPKGAMLTHKGIFTHALCYHLSDIAEPGMRMLFAMPAYHVSIHGVVSCLLRSGITVIVKKFDAEGFLKIIQEERITHTGLAPTMLNFVVNHPNFSQYDTSSLKQIMYGAAPISVALLRQLLVAFGPVFVQVFGQTESNGILTVLPKEDHKAEGSPKELERLKSCGKEWMLTEVRVVDDDGAPVKPGGEIGEIVARGDIVMKGYWNKPEDSAAALKDGWLHTGDMGYIDEDGYIYIVDRKKDMIISGGENIYPKEIENVIYTHPAVSECAVIGVYDEVWGESVKAIVSVRPGMKVTEEEITKLCKDNLAGYKKPKSVEVWDQELPKNPTGKILKTELRKRYRK